MKYLLALLLTLATFTAAAQSKFSGDYVGIASPVKWTNLERGVVSVLVFTDGSFIIEVLNYDFEFLDVEVRGTLDAKGRLLLLRAVTATNPSTAPGDAPAPRCHSA